MSYREPPRRMSPWAALAIAHVTGLVPFVLFVLGHWRLGLLWIGALVLIGWATGVYTRPGRRKAPDPKVEGFSRSGNPHGGEPLTRDCDDSR